jgi:hypothetical protein
MGKVVFDLKKWTKIPFDLIAELVKVSIGGWLIYRSAIRRKNNLITIKYLYRKLLKAILFSILESLRWHLS